MSVVAFLVQQPLRPWQDLSSALADLHW